MRKNLLMWTTLALLIVLFSTVLVLAAATFGPNTSTQPTWLNPDYEWMVEVDAIGNPDKVVCLDYSISPSGESGTTLCSCDDTIDAGDDCAVGTGHWTCTLPGNHDEQTITWATGTWSAGGGSSCGSEKTPAESGDFSTDPTAVTFSSMSANDGSPVALMSLILGLAIMVLIGMSVRYSRKNA